MKNTIVRIFFGFLIAVTLQACVTMGSQRFTMRTETFATNYPKIKKIVVEEAANNGFSELTSEVKPSRYNDYEGQLFFQLKTGNGTDQLFVEFKKVENGVAVNVHGGGTRANPASAAKAIEARLKEL